MRKITLDHITKIEGHARLELMVRKGKVEKVRVNVVESARFFEALVRERRCEEAPLLTSRICGICSPAHLICSIKAVENALGIKPLQLTEDLRRLLLAGSIIQNHATHLYFFALPDYLGFRDAVSIARKKPELIKCALALREAGNKLVQAIGHQRVHPFTARLNCFSRIPTRGALNALARELKNARPLAVKSIELFERVVDEDFERKTQYVALRAPSEYAFYDGDICFHDLMVCQTDYAKHIDEVVMPYSTAKYARFKGKPYECGALSRINLNKSQLTEEAREHARDFPAYSPYWNNIAQAIELLHFIDYCVDLLARLPLSQASACLAPTRVCPPREVRGIAAIEAPRGTLFHDYVVGADSLVKKANIITPTSQNLGNIEDDVKALVPELIRKRAPREKIIRELEKLVRAYDPCISCSTHFLEVDFK